VCVHAHAQPQIHKRPHTYTHTHAHTATHTAHNTQHVRCSFNTQLQLVHADIISGCRGPFLEMPQAFTNSTSPARQRQQQHTKRAWHRAWHRRLIMPCLSLRCEVLHTCMHQKHQAHDGSFNATQAWGNDSSIHWFKMPGVCIHCVKGQIQTGQTQFLFI